MQQPTKRTLLDRLRDILEYSNHALAFLADIDFVTFVNSIEKQLAVRAALETVGEAVKALPLSLREEYSAPWDDITGMRDKLIHGYFGINQTIIWRTTKEDLPAFMSVVQQIIDDLEQGKINMPDQISDPNNRQ